MSAFARAGGKTVKFDGDFEPGVCDIARR